MPNSQVVAIGVSTGGVDALSVLLSSLPADLSVPVLVVQHMPGQISEELVLRLNHFSSIPVALASHDTELLPGKVWLAPGGLNLSVSKHSGALVACVQRSKAENFLRPAINVLFRSVADLCRSGVVAVILTGMGCDGMEGCETVKKRGGRVIAQDQASSKVWEMPGAVVGRGLADAVLPLSLIGPEIVRMISNYRPAVAAD
jgi:two-component system chemotaxis response regulator CheB